MKSLSSQLFKTIFFLQSSLLWAVDYDHVFTKGDFLISNASDSNSKTSAMGGNRFKIISSDETGYVIEFEGAAAGRNYFVPAIFSQTFQHDPERKIKASAQTKAYFSVKNPDAKPDTLYTWVTPGEAVETPAALNYGDRLEIVRVEEDHYIIDAQGKRYVVYNSLANPEDWLEDSGTFEKATEVLDIHKQLKQNGAPFSWRSDEIPPGVNHDIAKGDILVREDPKKDEWGYRFHLASDPSKKVQLSKKYFAEFVEPAEGGAVNASPATVAQAGAKLGKSTQSKAPHTSTTPAPTTTPEITAIATSKKLTGTRDDQFVAVMNYYERILSVIPERFRDEAKRVCSTGGCEYTASAKCMNSGIYRELMTWLRTNLSTKHENSALFPGGASELFALMMTSYGEARGMTDAAKPATHDPMTRANMLAVIKVIKNRAARNQAQGANAMKIATQDRQFSMWNRTDPNFACMIVGKDRESVRRAASAYVDHIRGEVKYAGGMESKNVFHYHTNYVTAAWTNNKKRVSGAKIFVPPPPPKGTWVSLNDESSRGSYHKFFSDIRWSYANKFFRQ